MYATGISVEYVCDNSVLFLEHPNTKTYLASLPYLNTEIEMCVKSWARIHEEILDLAKT